jgi:hypothetical protein
VFKNPFFHIMMVCTLEGCMVYCENNTAKEITFQNAINEACITETKM